MHLYYGPNAWVKLVGVLVVMWLSIPLFYFGCIKSEERARESLGGIILWFLRFLGCLALVIAATALIVWR